MTPESDRDMDRLLGAVLPGTLAPASAECLDAERLAGWSEGALDSEEARSVETHLAGCARCQALAAVFARTEPAPAASVSPGVVIPMRRRWSMGWIAPLAAAAAALTLWIVWPGRESTSSITSAPPVAAPSQTMARAEENKQKAAETEPPAAGFAEPKNQARTQAPADADASRLDQLKKDATARRERDVAVNPAAAPAEAPKSAAPAISTVAPPPAPATPPPPPAAPASAAQTPAARPAQAAPPFAQSGQAAATRPAPPPPGATNEAVSVARPELQMRDSAAAAKLEATVPPVIEIVTVQAQVLDAISEVNTRQVAGGVAAGRGGGGGGRGGGARAVPPAPPPAAAPAAAPRWRILDGTRVERSTDNGATWLPLGIDLPARLTGGASPAPSVCWLIGERGLVLLSTNGLNFERITFPAAVNLTGIRATSAEAAAIATTDGRTFITSDGGRSWRLQGFPAGSF